MSCPGWPHLPSDVNSDRLWLPVTPKNAIVAQMMNGYFSTLHQEQALGNRDKENSLVAEHASTLTRECQREAQWELKGLQENEMTGWEEAVGSSTVFTEPLVFEPPSTRFLSRLPGEDILQSLNVLTLYSCKIIQSLQRVRIIWLRFFPPYLLQYTVTFFVSVM